mgnify:CR=1 FL=1
MSKHNCHPVTFGDGDVVLTGKEDITSKQSLDSIFTVNPNKDSRSQTSLKCETSTCQVQPFKYPGTQFGQLSDHYGMSINIS